MDVISLVFGDVVELKSGDVAGADLRVIECSDDCMIDQTTLVGDDFEDMEGKQGTSRKSITTETPPLHLQRDPLRCGNIIPMAAIVLQGSAVGVVLSTGDHTLWGQLILYHKWPRNTGICHRRKEEDTKEERTSLIV